MTPQADLVRIAYRTPYDWPRMLRFLAARAMQGVEAVEDDSYLRTVALGTHAGWIRVRNDPANSALLVELSPSLVPALPELVRRLAHLFDTEADPRSIDAHLARHDVLAASVRLRPGLRVPGAFDAFELVVRAILGQQITVKAATTIAGRFAKAFGDAIATPHAALTHLSPTARRIAAATIDEVASLGIIQTRARSIVAIAREIGSERLRLEPGVAPPAVIAQLVALPGIGPWTADYIAMRALSWSDAFPRGDIALRNALGRVTAARAEELSQPWRPWRSYATLHLWFAASEGSALGRL
jgi:AraC family transcriptional regulator of adaptative response / DNA-3-methyladenine glycosylase II